MAKLSVRQKAALDRSGALIPVGSIIAYAPGYFAAVANGGGWTVSGPSLNNVASVNTYLPANWKVCDGTAPNDSESPIFNSSSRYLPDLTGSRFLKGNTTAGTAGGNTSNQVTLSSANLPVHTHTAGTLVNASSAVTGTVGGSDGTHTHNSPYFTGNVVATSSGSNFRLYNNSIDQTVPITSNDGGHSHAFSLTATAQTISGSTGNGGFANSAFSILPLYVDTFYIMRIK